VANITLAPSHTGTVRKLSESSALDHDSGNVGGLIDLRPVPSLEDMKRSILRLRSQILGHADVQMGIGLTPDELNRDV